METPSSTRRVTRSQQASLLSLTEKKMQEAAERPLPSSSRSRGKKQDREVLHDITNDSPIVGLATGSLKTPSSSACKSSAWRREWTPGSGEALLRGQVKILLQKVEEEAEVVKNLAERPAPFQAFLGHLRSPGCLLAPTPANTPQVTGLPGNREGPTPLNSCAKNHVDSGLQQVSEIPEDEEETLDLRECLINRALFDSPEKSDISDSSINSSALTYEGSVISSCPKRSPDDDCSSAWSMQANAGSQREDEEEGGGVEEEFGGDDYNEFYYEQKEVEEEEREGLDALCEGLRTMSVQEKGGLPEFVGKHTRFVYNSDDEIDGEEEVRAGMVSPSVLRLRGLPAPEGKHLRFHEEEEEG